MRISHKFTVTLLGCVLVAVTLNAWSAVRTEIARFEDEIEAHQSAIGTALRPAVLDVWRTDGPARAMEIIQKADQNMTWVLIRWVWLGPVEGVESARPAIPSSRFAEVAASKSVSWVDNAKGPNGRLYTYVPVGTPDGRTGAIEVSQPLDRESAVRTAAIRRALLTIILAAAVTVLAATTLGDWLIGRPMQRIVEQARRTGGGDLTYRIRTTPHDEVGDLAVEMNRMCDSLAEAQERIAREADARLQAIDQLRHADRLATVGRLAAGMAHELGTPLNVVAARAKPIAAGTIAPEAARENARIVVEQVDRMSRLMRQLLDFARKRELQRADADLRSLLKRAVAFLSPLSRKRGVDLSVISPDQPVRARIDMAQMEQVLTNLVMNAIHASSEGQTIRVELADAEGTPPPEDGRGPLPCARIEVSDQGSGIPPQDLQRIFEPFFTTKPIGEGTGLGLAVAYGIVHDHGGWLEVASEPGKGSRFSVWLPREVA